MNKWTGMQPTFQSECSVIWLLNYWQLPHFVFISANYEMKKEKFWYVIWGFHKLRWQDIKVFWPTPLRWQFYKSLCSIVDIWVTSPSPLLVNVVYGWPFMRKLMFHKCMLSLFKGHLSLIFKWDTSPPPIWTHVVAIL